MISRTPCLKTPFIALNFSINLRRGAADKRTDLLKFYQISLEPEPDRARVCSTWGDSQISTERYRCFISFCGVYSVDVLNRCTSSWRYWFSWRSVVKHAVSCFNIILLFNWRVLEFLNLWRDYVNYLQMAVEPPAVCQYRVPAAVVWSLWVRVLCSDGRRKAVFGVKVFTRLRVSVATVDSIKKSYS